MRVLQRGQRRSKKGHSLLEMAAVAAIAGVLLSMVLASYKIRADKARLEESVDEMMSMAQASLDFYNDRSPQGVWPSAPGDLYPKYLYAAVGSSPFGGQYQIHGLSNAVTVSTTVPSGLAQNYYQGTLLQIVPGAGSDTISVTQELSHGFSGRLKYAKKYVYRQ